MTTTQNTKTTGLTYTLKNNTYWMYNNNVFIGAWDDKAEMDDFCESRNVNPVEVAA